MSAVADKLAAEASRYLATVDAFKAEGQEPSYAPEETSRPSFRRILADVSAEADNFGAEIERLAETLAGDWPELD